MTALYSVNYRIAGNPNVFLMNERSIFNMFSVPPALRQYFPLALIVVIALAAKLTLRLVSENKNRDFFVKEHRR